VGDAPGSTLSLPGGSAPPPSLRRPEPVLVLALECARPHAGSVRYRLAGLTGASLGRGLERHAERADSELVIRVPDKWMSTRHARLELTDGRWWFTDESKNGSIVDGHSTKRLALGDGSLIELGHTMFVFFENLPIEANAPAVLELIPTQDAPIMHTLLPAWQAELARIRQVAASGIPVMLETERGADKLGIARAIHADSRRTGAFLEFTCSELAAELVAGELFGDEDFEGLIRASSGGTLLLDDIGELPASSQDALLRVLQDRKVLQVTGTGAVDVDVRIITATGREVDDALTRDRFRPDLLAWLAGFRVVVPSLRERRTDLGLWIGALHQRLFADDHPGFDRDAARLLLRYPWPADLWELEQALAAARVVAGADPVSVEHLPETVRTGRSAGAPRRLALDEVDQQLHDRVLAALREHRGNVSAMARALDKDRKQIQRWLKRFGFAPESFR